MITDKHLFGLKQEYLLKERLEEAIGEPLEKTVGRYNKMDFVGKTHFVELKSRRDIFPDTYDTWLLPTCKKPKEKTDRDTVFFYYFEKDDSLWYLFYDETLFNGFDKERPWWHPERQEHWLIPRDCWSSL